MKNFGTNIRHIEDLKPQELLEFFHFWNNNQCKVTEKMDGMFMRFGIDATGNVFIGTKSKTWNTINDIPDIYYLADTKRYYTAFQQLPFQKIFGKELKKYGIVAISGEAIPTYNFNNVEYSKTLVGNGIFVIYNVSFGNDEVDSYQNISKLCETLNKFSDITFIPNPETTHLSKIKISKNSIQVLEKFVNAYSAILSKAARTPEAKKIKQAGFDLVKEIAAKVKAKFLSQQYQAALGNKLEGFVIHLPNNKMVKIVDKEEFTKSKDNNWQFINQFSDLYKKLEQALQTANDNFDIEFYTVSANNIFDEFEKNKHLITNVKKVEDTIKEYEYFNSIIYKCKQLRDNQLSWQQIGYLLKNKKIDDTLKELNIPTTNIPSSYVEPTLKEAIKRLNLENLNYKIVGSKKDIVGDIDVAVDLFHFQKTAKLSENKFWEDLRSFLEEKNVSYKINKGFRQFHLFIPLTDGKKHLNECFDVFGNKTTTVSYAQIDFILGNLTWMKDILSEAPGSHYKAALRNILLGCLCKNIEDSPLTMNLREGVTKFQNKERILVAESGDEIANLVCNTTWNEINTFEKLFEKVIQNQLSVKINVEKTLEDFKRLTIKAGFDIPNELKEGVNMGKTIGIYAGSFKPFHIGHWNALKLAAQKCDQIILIISTSASNRDGISSNKSIEYFKAYISPLVKQLNKSVKIIGSPTPIRSVYQTIEAANKNDFNNTYVLFADKKDFEDRYKNKSLKRSAPLLALQGRLKGVYTPRIASGTDVRESLQNGDLKAFMAYLPEPLRPKAKEIFNFLNSADGPMLEDITF